MPQVLITAFGPYAEYPDNASWLALMELTRDYPELAGVTTRRLPVDFAETRERIEQELQTEYDVILHLGQAVGSNAIELEQIALNIGCDGSDPTAESFELVADGPVAYRSSLALGDWSEKIRDAGIPCKVSHHAGTYLCNAVLYWTSHMIATSGWNSQVGFIHLPLSPQQNGATRSKHPMMPTSMAAKALQIILQQINVAHQVV